MTVPLKTITHFNLLIFRNLIKTNYIDLDAFRFLAQLQCEGALLYLYLLRAYLDIFCCFIVWAIKKQKCTNKSLYLQFFFKSLQTFLTL